MGGPVSLGLGAASLGMSIIGAAGQSQAQRDAGQVAYENALLRRNAAYQQAAAEDVAAGQQVAAGQRQQVEALREGQIQAARLRAVMGASGAGVDENLIADIAGQGKYAGDVAAYDAAEKARSMRDQAALTRWSGDMGVAMGGRTRDAMDSAASATLIGGIGTGVLSFASKYGGGLFGGSDKAVAAVPGGFTTDQAKAMATGIDWGLA